VSVLVDLARAADRMKDHEGALGYLAHARALAPDDAEQFISCSGSSVSRWTWSAKPTTR
jgi:hypothetical protein